MLLSFHWSVRIFWRHGREEYYEYMNEESARFVAETYKRHGAEVLVTSLD